MSIIKSLKEMSTAEWVNCVPLLSNAQSLVECCPRLSKKVNDVAQKVISKPVVNPNHRGWTWIVKSIPVAGNIALFIYYVFLRTVGGSPSNARPPAPKTSAPSEEIQSNPTPPQQSSKQEEVKSEQKQEPKLQKPDELKAKTATVTQKPDSAPQQVQNDNIESDSSSESSSDEVTSDEDQDDENGFGFGTMVIDSKATDTTSENFADCQLLKQPLVGVAPRRPKTRAEKKKKLLDDAQLLYGKDGQSSKPKRAPLERTESSRRIDSYRNSASSKGSSNQPLSPPTQVGDEFLKYVAAYEKEIVQSSHKESLPDQLPLVDQLQVEVEEKNEKEKKDLVKFYNLIYSKSMNPTPVPKGSLDEQALWAWFYFECFLSDCLENGIGIEVPEKSRAIDLRDLKNLKRVPNVILEALSPDEERRVWIIYIKGSGINKEKLEKAIGKIANDIIVVD